MGRWKNKIGFTLIELLVVVIIVAVLAAVGIPLLTGNVERARASEAEAGLGTIRTSLRAKFAEFSSYASANALTPINANIGLKAGDLNGRFFDDNAYTAIGANATQFCATANGTASTAPQAPKVQGTSLVQRSMNQDGNIGNAPCAGVNIGGTCLNC